MTLVRRRGQPLAAILSKFCTAAGSFALQALAARALGAGGLGSFALVYSVLLMVAASCNGLVGDSLTALDRSRPEIRAALTYWCAVNAVVASALGAGFLMLAGGLSASGAALFAFASVAFVLESALRRLLQAAMLFWASVVIEIAGSVGALVVLGARALVGPLDLSAFVVALAGGQIVALAVAMWYTPADERWLSIGWPAAMREVGAFGFWRAGQQTIRPGVLTAVRSVIYHFSGRAMLGQLEAARVYMSPALLAVQGLSTYLFSSYAASKNATTAQLIRRADRAVLGLSSCSLLAGLAGTALVPWAGDVVTGGNFSVSAVAVFGWAVYAAASAAVTPYQSLAAARGRQVIVTGLRAVDAALSLIACIALLAAGLSPSWVPYVLSAGSCLGGGLIRAYALRPMAAAERRMQRSAPASAPVAAYHPNS